jgi:hypothetical protein
MKSTVFISMMFCFMVFPNQSVAGSPEILGFINTNCALESEYSSFDIARVRVGLSDAILFSLSYFIITEWGSYSPAGAGRFSMIDAHVTWHLSRLANLRFGQDWN